LRLILDRDPAFWSRVNEHPEVNPHTTLGQTDYDLPAFINNPRVTPLRSTNGGILLVDLDGAGQVVELHIMFTPEGWGREALMALTAAVEWAFGSGAQVITTYQARGTSRWTPPASFRFQQAGEFQLHAALGVELRSWVLTKRAWETSPAYRRR